MSEEKIKTPRIFISYSWTNEEYTTWVRELATELSENNIDVELDQWSLREGDNKYVYMEKMVTDKTIDKVIILCDKKYQIKADGKDGGVGTEATIMTPEIYKSVKDTSGSQKFIPIITERDPETNEEYMPVFLNGKTYIDFTDKDHYAEKFEQLVRAIHNKPLYIKPTPGKIPQYLLEDTRISLGTSARRNRAESLLKDDKPQALSAVRDYFSTFAENLKEFDIDSKDITYTLIIDRLKEMVSARDEVVDLISVIVRYSTDSKMYEEIRAFFESLMIYLEPRETDGFFKEWSSEHYKFFVHELFLYTIAILLKNKRFAEVNELIDEGYYRQASRYSGNKAGLVSYCIFDTHSEALDQYNRSLQSSFYSIYAKFLNDRVRSDVRFEDLSQADFFLYLRSKLEENPEDFIALTWFPDTLLHNRHRNQSFEIFARSESKKFFEKVAIGLGGATKAQIGEIIENLKGESSSYFNSSISGTAVENLVGYKKLETRP